MGLVTLQVVTLGRAGVTHSLDGVGGDVSVRHRVPALKVPAEGEGPGVGADLDRGVDTLLAGLQVTQADMQHKSF
jgi:hypothetical protein